MPEARYVPELPEGWRDVVLGDVGEFSTSSVDKKVNTAELPVRLVNYMDVYRSSYLTSQLDYMQVTASRSEILKSQVLIGDLLFTPSSETPDDVGHSAVVIEALPKTLHSYHTVRLRVATAEEIDLRFRGRFANSTQVLKHFEKCATGSTRYTLSLGDFRSAPVRLPPIAEQAKIAQVLDTLDTTIRQTEAIIEKLKQVKQGLLHDLLTRGIDANGELRPPQSQAPHLYKKSPLGWIPREWSTSSIDEACSDVVDCPHSTPHFLDDGVLVARTMHIKAGVFLDRLASRVSEAEYKERIARLRPEPGDVVFTREAPVGEAFVIPVGMRVCLGQRVMLLRPSPDKLRGKFLLAQIYSGAVADRISTLTSGTTNPHLNVAEVRQFILPLPPAPEQTVIEHRLGALDSRIDIENSECEKLQTMKAGLMDDLLTGRVRVTSLIG